MSGASSHFVLAMVQLSQRTALPSLTRLRQELHLPAGFEFKYYRMRERQKMAFFDLMGSIPIRVRAVFVDKQRLGTQWLALNGQELTVELLVRLTLRTSELDLANDVLVIDGATPALRKALRVRLSHECVRLGRTRPFSNIAGANSSAEDGLQLADIVAGAIRGHVSQGERKYYRTFSNRMVDLWDATDANLWT